MWGINAKTNRNDFLHHDATYSCILRLQSDCIYCRYLIISTRMNESNELLPMVVAPHQFELKRAQEKMCILWGFTPVFFSLFIMHSFHSYDDVVHLILMTFQTILHWIPLLSIAFPKCKSFVRQELNRSNFLNIAQLFLWLKTMQKEYQHVNCKFFRLGKWSTIFLPCTLGWTEMIKNYFNVQLIRTVLLWSK